METETGRGSGSDDGPSSDHKEGVNQDAGEIVPPPKASVIIVTYNSRGDIEDCLASVCSQTYDNYEVIVVDNDSTDDTVDYVHENHPEVRILANEENRWYPGGNNDGFDMATGEYLVVLNPDVEVAPDWLASLVSPLKSGREIGLTTSRVVQFNNRDRLNTCGNIAHYTGLGFCRGLDEPVNAFPEEESVPAVSGCSFAMRREVYETLGGFDETLRMYSEDLDLSWRAHLAGYDILYVPDSVVYHKYELTVKNWKFFNLERNRHLILLKHLHSRSLLKLLPGLILTELLVWIWATIKGPNAIAEKVRAWSWIWHNRDQIRRKHEKIQGLRHRADRELLNRMDVRLPLDQFGVPALARPLVDSLVWVCYRPWHYLATGR